MAQHLHHDPPPDAPPPGAGTRADDKSGWQARLNRQSTRRLTIWGRHARWACEARSFQSGPCPRCCRCRRDCTHPAFAEMTEEVAHV